MSVQEADVVRNLILAATLLSCLAACGSPDLDPVGHDGAQASPCAQGCQPGSAQVRMHMTVVQTWSYRR